ncbi:MAG: ABC transporter permease [bacterium]
MKQKYRLFGNLLILGIILLILLCAPLITRFNPNAQNEPALNRYRPPSSEYWFGTDQFGRDVFARVLYGGRISLFIAFSVVLFSLLFGAFYGAISGYLGNIWDRVLMRFVDMLLAFPVVFLAVSCMALFGFGLWGLIIVLIFTSWMDVARLVRAEVQSLKQRPFILKARAVGLNTPSILVRHLMPNVMATLLAVAVIRVADIILIESALSFLGLGVQPPTASLGSIINDGRPALSFAWWMTVFPGLAIVLTVMSLHWIAGSLKKG